MDYWSRQNFWTSFRYWIRLDIILLLPLLNSNHSIPTPTHCPPLSPSLSPLSSILPFSTLTLSSSSTQLLNSYLTTFTQTPSSLTPNCPSSTPTPSPQLLSLHLLLTPTPLPPSQLSLPHSYSTPTPSVSSTTSNLPLPPQLTTPASFLSNRWIKP